MLQGVLSRAQNSQPVQLKAILIFKSFIIPMTHVLY